MTDRVTILSSVCGHHFGDDCESCASAKESNDHRLEALSERIAVQQKAIEVAFQKGADLAVFIANQRQNPQPPTMKQLDEMADLLVAVRASLTPDLSQ